MENTNKELNAVHSLLKITYVIIPIAAGADKFANLLTNWADYLNPSLAGMLPFSAATFMMIVGAIEIIAGILVLISPQKGGYLVAAWLVLIALTLLGGWMYADVAVRDLAMAAGAFSLARISRILNK
jgi:hypothetical protein